MTLIFGRCGSGRMYRPVGQWLGPCLVCAAAWNELLRENARLRRELEAVRQVAEANCGAVEVARVSRLLSDANVHEGSGKAIALTIRECGQEALKSGSEKQVQRFERLLGKGMPRWRSSETPSAGEARRGARAAGSSAKDHKTAEAEDT